MYKRSMAALAISTALALGVVACAGDSGKREGGETLKGTVTMWVPPTGGDAQAEQGYWNKSIEGFKKVYPDVSVKVEVIPWEGRGERLTTAVAGRTTPDVAYMLPTDVANYGDMRVLEDVSGVIAEDRADFRPNALEALTVNGVLSGVPTLMSVTTTMFNKDVLNALGVKPPETWDDVRQVAEKAKAAGYYTTQYEGAPSQTLNGSFYPLLWQAGGDLLNEEKTEAAFNGKEGREALEFVKWLVDNGYTPRDSVTSALPVETSPVANGKVLMVISRSLASMTSNGLAKEDILIAPPLKNAKQASYGTVAGFSIFKQSKNKPASEAWVKWITSPDQMREFLPPRNAHSPRLSVGDLYEPGSLQFADGEQLDYMTIGLNIPKATKIMEILKPHLQSALLGKVEPQAALDAAAKEVNSLLAG
jgi:multiple sugar transport system substrate-binding protein